MVCCLDPGGEENVLEGLVLVSPTRWTLARLPPPEGVGPGGCKGGWWCLGGLLKPIMFLVWRTDQAAPSQGALTSDLAGLSKTRCLRADSYPALN